MPSSPTIVTRDAQPYLAIRRSITMSTFAEIADRLPELFAWLAERGIAPAGPPFFRYLVIDMARRLEMEAGVPVAVAVPGDAEVLAGVLPAGRFATLTHRGHPEELVGVTAGLLAWGHEHELVWDMTPADDGEHWGCRIELLLTDPAEEPDMRQWETELAFRLA